MPTERKSEWKALFSKRSVYLDWRRSARQAAENKTLEVKGASPFSKRVSLVARHPGAFDGSDLPPS